MQASIACIIGGRVASLVGKANFKIKMGKFKILEMIVDQLLWILHDCFRCFRGKENINVLNWSPTIHYLLNGTFSDFNFVLNGIIYLQYYLFTFTSNGFTLCKPYTNLKMWKNNILQRCKKKWRRMWRDVWVSCNLVFASFKTYLDYGKWI